MPSSSVSHLCISPQSNAITWFWNNIEALVPSLHHTYKICLYKRHTHKQNRCPYLECPFLGAGVQLEVVNADGCDDVAFTSGVAGTVGEHDLIVALASPQQTQILREKEAEGRGDKTGFFGGFFTTYYNI